MPGGSSAALAPGRVVAGWNWVVERRLVLCVGLAAALPIAVAIVYALIQRWAPLGDDAYVAARAFDVFTDRFPLLGQRSAGASGATFDQAKFSPGPMLFWLLAVPARLPEPALMSVTVGLVNVACVVGVVALARRRGGLPLMFAAAIAVPLMLASLPAETYSDVWNPSAPLMSIMLLVFLAWSVACGEYRLLPLTVLVASFAAQTHLSFVAPALGLTVVGMACGLVSGRPPLRWAIAAIVVGVVCWTPPLIEQATHSPGNLVLLERSAFEEHSTLGIEAGWRSLVHTVGVPPW
jgi:hypothetical protein